jgi:dihydroorotate dehydrogenase (NAD+) catalytic subunit
METPAGLLCVGAWPARALASALGAYAAVWASWRTPVLLSVAGDYAAVAGALEGVEGVAGLELSVEDPDDAAKAVAAARAVTLLPLLAKLPIHDAIAETAKAAAAAGADALTVGLPQRASAPEPATGDLLRGRLAGPAARPLALWAVAEVCAAVTIPVVGCGGVTSAADARAFLAAGATAVQVGSALLSDPWAAARIAEELR